MKILYVNPCGATDLSLLLERSGASVSVVPPTYLITADICGYDAFVFDGTGTATGLLFRPAERVVADRIAYGGKPLLCILCPHIMTLSCTDPKNTRFDRPVVSPDFVCDGLEEGDILDEQTNLRVCCYRSAATEKPLMYYKHNPVGFYKTETVTQPAKGDMALWREKSNVLFCAFACANFARARFAPRRKWYAFFAFILKSVFSLTPDEAVFDGIYRERGYFTVREDKPLDVLLRESADRAVRWHFDADMTKRNPDGSPYTMKEGMGAEVYPDGTQSRPGASRTDSPGETALMFALHDHIGKNSDKADFIQAFSAYTLSHVNDYGGIFNGYGGAGDDAWWYASYGDDLCRGIIYPQLFAKFAGLGGDGLDRALDCLDYLVRTTGSDGLRFCRTDVVSFEEGTVSAFDLVYNGKKWSWGSGKTLKAEDLSKMDACTPSAHYNGFYLATLLLAYKVTGKEIYRDTAVRGLTTMMEKYYPNTAREHSETQDLSRLVLPLAYLYWVTGDQKHLGWLNAVLDSLTEKRTENGAFIEWDTGYIACCAGQADGECSVLAENGNPVVDLLYSLNWLPSGLAQAYLITGDERIKDLFEGLARFLVGIQLHSSNKDIDGAWARAFDCAGNEVYGVPNDVGWAPWSIETGWTMAEIPTGFMIWLLRDELKKLFS